MPTKALIPFLVFVIIVGFLVVGLNRNPREVPSPFIGKSAPDFTLPTLSDSTISKQNMIGKVWLLNVWASWCVACLQEHPLLIQLSKQGFVDIIGLNYKDTDPAAKTWLRQHGNPYHKIAVDTAGNVGIDYGVYGVPETFVMDKEGMIHLKHIGPLQPEDINQTIIPLVTALKAQSS